MKNEKLTIFLSPGELFCIAGSLGLPNLPLVGTHYRGYTPEEIRDDINHGRKLLESRGLITRIGPRDWEVDSSLTALVDAMAHPEYCLLHSTWKRSQSNQQHFVYVKSRQAISVTYRDRYFNISVFRDVRLMVKYTLTGLGIQQQPSQGVPDLLVPMADLRGLLMSLWEHPEAAAETLEELGLQDPDLYTAAEHLPTVQTASNLTLITPEGERFNRLGQMVFLSNASNLWINESQQPTNGPALFQPEQGGRAGIRVERFVRGKAGEDEAPAAPENDEKEYV